MFMASTPTPFAQPALVLNIRVDKQERRGRPAKIRGGPSGGSVTHIVQRGHRMTTVCSVTVAGDLEPPARSVPNPRCSQENPVTLLLLVLLLTVLMLPVLVIGLLACLAVPALGFAAGDMFGQWLFSPSETENVTDTYS